MLVYAGIQLAACGRSQRGERGTAVLLLTAAATVAMSNVAVGVAAGKQGRLATATLQFCRGLPCTATCRYFCRCTATAGAPCVRLTACLPVHLPLSGAGLVAAYLLLAWDVAAARVAPLCRRLADACRLRCCSRGRTGEHQPLAARPAPCTSA